MPLGDSRLRQFPDAPLAHLIGTPAKRVKEIGAPSLKHPFASVFPAIVATSPLANSSGAMRAPSIGNRESWPDWRFSAPGGRYHSISHDRLGQWYRVSLLSRNAAHFRRTPLIAASIVISCGSS